MVTTVQHRTATRFALVSAGHHLLLNVLPFREPESSHALATFLAAVRRLDLPAADTDAILIRCLAVLDHHERRVPSLVDRYVGTARLSRHPVTHFAACVEDLLRYRCVGDAMVQQAMAIVHARLSDSTLRVGTIASVLGIRVSSLCTAFKRETAQSLGEYIRQERIQRAAILLSGSIKTIKEVWVEVGYSHASNFVHDFKRTFGVSPREFRKQVIQPVAQCMSSRAHIKADSRAVSESLARSVKILLVDDDEDSARIISTYLRDTDYVTANASSGADGLAQLKCIQPDVLVLDYRLPDMTGMQFLRTLRRDSRYHDQPAVIVFTCDLDALDLEDEAHALNAIVVSRLCSLEQLRDLIDYVSTADTIGQDRCQQCSAGFGALAVPSRDQERR